MIGNAKLAGDLIGCLGLKLPPIAVSFSTVAPANIPPYDGVVPAGCVFWQEAATRTFVTTAKDHALCSIGVHTHHLAQPARTYLSELGEALKAMCDLDYVRPEEVATIPLIKQEVKHVIYGPLAVFRLFPEVVILFAHARQSLILSEATARVDKGIPLAMGRPACAVVPQVLNRGNAAMSLGCCGARLPGYPDRRHRYVGVPWRQTRAISFRDCRAGARQQNVDNVSYAPARGHRGREAADRERVT